MLLLLAAMLYWSTVCAVADVQEPWDAKAYWRLWYPVSLILSAVAGLVVVKRAWRAGAILTFAQLPVLWINAGIGPLWPVGLALLCLLSIPAIATSALAGWLMSRRRSA